MEPKIRFKGFSGEWETRRVGELCDVLTGFPFEGSKILSKGKELLMRGINITEGVIRHNVDIDRYYDEDASFLSKYRLKKNDLVIGMDGSKVGKNSALVTEREENSLLVQRVARLRNPNAYLIRLIQIAIGSSRFFEYVDSMKTSSAIPHISPSDIKCFTLSVSKNKEEIKYVASLFQCIDSLILSTSKKIDSLKQVKAASLQSMFPQGGETTPRVRFKGFEGDWENVLVGRLGTTYSGLSGKTKEDFGFGDARYVTFLNVLTNAKIDTSILEAVNVREGEHQNEVKKGDLLFNTSSETPEEVGMCAVMDEELKCVYLNSFCFGFRVTDENIDSTFIAYLMRSHIGRRIMSILAQGATRYNLSKNSFCKAELLLPKTKEEQQQIASYFTSLDKQISLQTQRLEKLKQIKAACLDNMFV